MFDRDRRAAEPSKSHMFKHLHRANAVALRSLESGKHPFGCILVGPDHESVLLEQGNIDTVNHAESTLIRDAWARFDQVFLSQCTLYSTVEPCCMCAGTLYWANLGQLVYAIAEERLLEITGAHNENPTLNIPCRYVFEHGQRDITVFGPFPELEEEFLAVHQEFWRQGQTEL